MQYELYDILTIEDKKYIIASIICENATYYYLLLEVDDEENIHDTNVKVCKQAALNNAEPDILYPVEDEKELSEVTKLLYSAMRFDLKQE
mgnify:CR=1 FL=1